MSLEFEKAKAQFISTFSREIGRFDFRNSAGEAALRCAIAIIYGACPIQFLETGKLQAAMSIRAIAEESGMSRSRTERAVAGLERFDVLITSKVASSSKTLYALRPPNVWKSWIDLMKSGRAGAATMQQKSGRADEATFENQGGRAGVASLEGKVAASVRPHLSSNKIDAGSEKAKIMELPEGDGARSGATRSPIPYEVPEDERDKMAVPQDSAGSASWPTGLARAALGKSFIGMSADQARDAAELYFAESLGADFQEELFVEDLVDGFDPTGGNPYAHDGVKRALRDALSDLTAAEAAGRLDDVLAVAEALLVSMHGPRRELSKRLADLARNVLSGLPCSEVKNVG